MMCDLEEFTIHHSSYAIKGAFILPAANVSTLLSHLRYCACRNVLHRLSKYDPKPGVAFSWAEWNNGSHCDDDDDDCDGCVNLLYKRNAVDIAMFHLLFYCSSLAKSLVMFLLLLFFL